MKCEIITGELRERPPGLSTELVEKAGESPTKRAPSEVDVQIYTKLWQEVKRHALQCSSQVMTFSFTLAIFNDGIYWGCGLI